MRALRHLYSACRRVQQARYWSSFDACSLHALELRWIDSAHVGCSDGPTRFASCTRQREQNPLHSNLMSATTDPASQCRA